VKSGNLNFLEPSGSLQACNGTALPLFIPVTFCHTFRCYQLNAMSEQCILAAQRTCEMKPVLLFMLFCLWYDCHLKIVQLFQHTLFYNFLADAPRKITNPTFIIQRMKPRAHIVIIKIGARSNVVGNGMTEFVLFISLWNGEHIFVTVYALQRVGYILNSDGYKVIAEPREQATPFFRAPTHIEPYNLLWVLSDWNRLFWQKAVTCDIWE
jgi:hypothetical protein